MLLGNKGEWSEPYVFLKLLADGRIYAGDENLKRIEAMYFPILKVIGEAVDNHRYEYRVNQEARKIAIFFNNQKVKELDSSAFREEAERLYHIIVQSKGRSFAIEETEKFLNSVKRFKLKMTNDRKSDIAVQVHDIQTGYEPEIGFSIKSELGNAPTLINASKATNFVYEVAGLTDSDIDNVNKIDGKTKIFDRLSYIEKHCNDIVFVAISNKTFQENLMLIDSRMPEIIAEVLKAHYLTGIRNCELVLEKVGEKNPLSFPRKDFYAYKFKKFLCASALGMMPATLWSGDEEANGGYIVVSKSGDVLAYHIYNRTFFESYLLNHTIFERSSTTRHDYAYLYKKDGKTYLNLNLQVRFI